MKLRTLLSMMLVAGGMPGALARMPFESDFAPRLSPALNNDPPPSSSRSAASPAEDSATKPAPGSVARPTRQRRASATRP